MYRTELPPRCRATNKNDASARPSPAPRFAAVCLLHLSSAYVHGCLLFSLPRSATGKRRRCSFSGNARRSPGNDHVTWQGSRISTRERDFA
ncbi:hypothetical protein PUN28_004687 [Cardiocondyla obscurior]|uniref:Uncharacterized protein n=1 Tax=Cardiocondyla obscurior TaxID=286306 RepID=A0AAW2GE10_9HYME